MTRKHYEALSRWAAEQKFGKDLVDSLSGVVGEFNAKFDEERFKKACNAQD